MSEVRGRRGLGVARQSPRDNTVKGLTTKMKGMTERVHRMGKRKDAMYGVAVRQGGCGELGS